VERFNQQKTAKWFFFLSLFWTRHRECPSDSFTHDAHTRKFKISIKRTAWHVVNWSQMCYLIKRIRYAIFPSQWVPLYANLDHIKIITKTVFGTKN
jgi:hypothetical protein